MAFLIIALALTILVIGLLVTKGALWFTYGVGSISKILYCSVIPSLLITTLVCAGVGFNCHSEYVNAVTEELRAYKYTGTTEQGLEVLETNLQELNDNYKAKRKAYIGSNYKYIDILYIIYKWTPEEYVEVQDNEVIIPESLGIDISV